MADWKEESAIQFSVKYNKETGVFSILNLWDDSVRNLPPDVEIPANSSAMKTLSNLEVNALLGKVNEMGWIQKMFGTQPKSDAEAALSQPRKTIQEVAIENIYEVAKLGGDEGVAKESVMAIREIVNKVYGS